VRKRIAIASLLLLAALAAMLWADRTAGRSRARSAAGDGSGAASAAEVEESPGPSTGVDAAAARGLFGRVLEEGSDAPVAGAAVAAYAFEAGRVLRTTSAEDGTFDLPDAPAAGHAFQLVVRREGLGGASLRAVLDGDAIVVRLPRGGALRGRVVTANDRRGVSPCRVLALRMRGENETWDTNDALLRQLLPDELVIEADTAALVDGTFGIAVLAPGRYALHLDAPGFAPFGYGARRRERVEILAGATTEIEIELPGTAGFLIDVFDEESEKPLDGATFEFAVGAGWLRYVPAPAERLDSGAYLMSAGFGKRGFDTTWLRVSREGYASRLSVFQGQTAGHRFRTTLGRSAAIEGQVRPSGTPLPNALVIVERESDRNAIGSFSTRADGRFEISGLDPCVSLRVRVYDRTLDPLTVVPVELGYGERRTLDIGGTGVTAIEGRVVLGTAPVAKVSVWVSGASECGAATGRDGTYRIEGLNPGRHEVVFSSDDLSFTRHVDLAQGVLRLDLVASALISGVVVDQTGAAVTNVADLEVVARRVDAETGGSWSAGVDDNGLFRLHVDAGVHELDCPFSEEVYAVERPRVSLPDGAESPTVTLRVARDPQDGRIEIEVKDGATGETVPEGDYEYEGKAWSGAGGFDEGLVADEDLPVGSYRFRIWSDNHVPSEMEITLTPGNRLFREKIALRPADAVRITEIQRGSPGAAAGLREGDTILSCNGTRTTSVAELHAALGEARGTLTIEFERAGERRVATVTANRIGAEIENILLDR
jgi:hypothetical protein